MEYLAVPLDRGVRNIAIKCLRQMDANLNLSLFHGLFFPNIGGFRDRGDKAIANRDVLLGVKNVAERVGLRCGRPLFEY